MMEECHDSRPALNSLLGIFWSGILRNVKSNGISLWGIFYLVSPLCRHDTGDPQEILVPVMCIIPFCTAKTWLAAWDLSAFLLLLEVLFPSLLCPELYLDHLHCISRKLWCCHCTGMRLFSIVLQGGVRRASSKFKCFMLLPGNSLDYLEAT